MHGSGATRPTAFFLIAISTVVITVFWLNGGEPVNCCNTGAGFVSISRTYINYVTDFRMILFFVLKWIFLYIKFSVFLMFFWLIPGKSARKGIRNARAPTWTARAWQYRLLATASWGSTARFWVGTVVLSAVSLSNSSLVKFIFFSLPYLQALVPERKLGKNYLIKN
jgi:hypothetical protein